MGKTVVRGVGAEFTTSMRLAFKGGPKGMWRYVSAISLLILLVIVPFLGYVRRQSAMHCNARLAIIRAGGWIETEDRVAPLSLAAGYLRYFCGINVDSVVPRKESILSFSEASLDAQVISIFGQFPELNWVELRDCKISGEGYLALSSITGLQGLILECSNVSDENIRNLASADTLEYLDLSLTAITDESVDALAAMSRLRDLRIDKTHVTGEGVTRLLRMRPDLKVSWYTRSDTPPARQ